MQICLGIIPLKYKEYIESNNLPNNELTLRQWKNVVNDLGLKPRYKNWLKKHNLEDSYATLLQYKHFAEYLIKNREED